ncbi:hypothetical protein [Herminiimonas fonticola]|uniref:Uncharacterized protein n=1 Tax=Herminiimonas fonticola TaxID=303380 RepID=A0A4R6GI31_9BURK|nr:hypothetical protein [Herminiimonas fonticola]RBA25460.1 hypothetical protein Hfont_1093 [Herminiimonas fonticola]TDN94573.1 hypothetical protein EV677_1123 [Herminiimonas fonticola]
MLNRNEWDQFHIELKQRFEDLVSWAVAHRPDHSPPLSSADFETARKEIMKLAVQDLNIGERNAKIPEPAENGPQYVNLNPAPWP